jgi:hypothetical protein
MAVYQSQLLASFEVKTFEVKKYQINVLLLHT